MFLKEWKKRRKQAKLQEVKNILTAWNNVMPRKLPEETVNKWVLILYKYSIRKINRAIKDSLHWHTQNGSVDYLNFPSIWIWIS